ncbi:MAG: riboflavin synthase [Salibacteraceae bacterium]
MFSGIVEALGEVVGVNHYDTNCDFTLRAPFTGELKVDQSVAHNGVCLTVVKINGSDYTVTAVEETLLRSNLSTLRVGDLVNLERCLRLSDRLDGHLVQGHVDCTASLASVSNNEGSWMFEFELSENHHGLIVHKGSIAVNGVSLTVAKVRQNGFAVAVIPYTYEHTNLHLLKPGAAVNIEFDIIGKYVLSALNSRMEVDFSK